MCMHDVCTSTSMLFQYTHVSKRSRCDITGRGGTRRKERITSFTCLQSNAFAAPRTQSSMGAAPSQPSLHGDEEGRTTSPSGGGHSGHCGLPLGHHSEAQQRRGSHLFIAMEELHGDKWDETGRWNHALAEDLGEDLRWSRPHLPTISVPALVRLRSTLTRENVILDSHSATFAAAIQEVLAIFVAQGALREADRALATKTLARARKSDMHGAMKVGGLKTPMGLRARKGADVDNVKMLAPDKGEEAFNLLVAHVPYVQRQALVFVRLRRAIEAGVEGHAVRLHLDQ